MTAPDGVDGATVPADTPTPPVNPSSTGWTVTTPPHHGATLRIALLCGAALNITALAILATILIDGPRWLVITLTAATALLAIAARYTIRAINTGGAVKSSRPQQIHR